MIFAKIHNKNILANIMKNYCKIIVKFMILVYHKDKTMEGGFSYDTEKLCWWGSVLR